MDAPEKVCLLRLSAIGDTCHVVPLLRTMQDAWPRTRFTWVIGKLEAKLMSLIPDVELITVDKGAGLSAYSRLRTEMQRRGAFDLLLHLLHGMLARLHLEDLVIESGEERLEPVEPALVLRDAALGGGELRALLLEGETVPMRAGQVVVAPAGVPHGLRNTGKERLLVLAILAPAPG